MTAQKRKPGPGPSRLGSRKKTAETTTIRECLRCGRDHKSTWPGDRICPSCRKSCRKRERNGAFAVYSPEYSVTIGSRSSSFVKHVCFL